MLSRLVHCCDRMYNFSWFQGPTNNFKWQDIRLYLTTWAKYMWLEPKAHKMMNTIETIAAAENDGNLQFKRSGPFTFLDDARCCHWLHVIQMKISAFSHQLSPINIIGRPPKKIYIYIMVYRGCMFVNCHLSILLVTMTMYKKNSFYKVFVHAMELQSTD